MQDIDKTLAALEMSSVVAATIADRPVSHICRLLLGQAAKEHRTPRAPLSLTPMMSQEGAPPYAGVAQG